MCTNYRPTSRELIDDYFDTSAPDIEFREEAYPGYQAPIIRLAHEVPPPEVPHQARRDRRSWRPARIVQRRSHHSR